MKTIRQILLLFLALIYATHCYSRLVHTPPIYITVSTGISSKSVIQNNLGQKKSFILHRRHLPLTKKLEIGKLYPTLNYSNSNTSIYQNSVSLHYHLDILYSLSFSNLLNNKAPPFYC